MIKYLHDKITGRPTMFSSTDDLSLNDNPPPMKRTQSQSSLNDVMSISITSNSNDLPSIDRTTSQVEKLTAGIGGVNFGQRYTTSSSSPIIIPKKPARSNTSSQSSSSYTSIADQMFSSSETSTQSYRTSDDAWNMALPTLPSVCQRLEHSAARDRILVKNKRRQPIKQNLTTLRETDDNQNDLFSVTTKEEEKEQTNVLPSVEFKTQLPQQQLVVDDSMLDTARTHLRTAVRPRDHSADNILTTIPINVSSIQRSTSFKRPQEITETKPVNRFIFPMRKDGEEEKKIVPKAHTSSQEHIYDNLDLFKRHKINLTSEASPNHENDSSTSLLVQTREQSFVTTTRLRPVTMHITTNTNNNDKPTTNEFENMFNQLKKRDSIRTETSVVPSLDEPLVAVEESSPLLSTENLSSMSLTVPTSPVVKLVSVSPVPNRRKTVGGVNLLTKNKVAATEEKPTPSWIDIAKQKQSKFQSTPTERNQHEELDQPSIEPAVISRKPITNTSNITLVNENTSENIRLNRKSMYEPVITRRASPSKTSINTEILERDSIRALKAGSPNRINNLIQFFDK